MVVALLVESAVDGSVVGPTVLVGDWMSLPRDPVDSIIAKGGTPSGTVATRDDGLSFVLDFSSPEDAFSATSIIATCCLSMLYIWVRSRTVEPLSLLVPVLVSPRKL